MRMLTFTHFVGLLYCLSVGVESIEGSVELPVYAQPASTSKYVEQRYLPSTTELTLCFKLDAEETQPGTTSTLFGTAVPVTGSDWGVSFTDSEIYAYNGYSKKKVLYTNLNGTILSMLTGWHTHCFTWKASGNTSWYSDQTEAGRMDLQGTEQSQSSPSELLPIARLTMLQHRYDRNGFHVDKETTTGNITWINMWDYEMSAEEISGLGCGAKGNAINEATLSSRNLNPEYTLICEDNSEVELSVYTQHADILRFIYQKDLPALSELTICFKLNAEDTQPGSLSSLVSIATPDKANDWYLAYSSREMKLYRNSLTVVHKVSSGEILDMLIGWHTHCFTWTAGGNITWYSDQTETGRMDLIATELVSDTSSIQEDGVLIMLQDQDSYFGDLELRQTTAGEITWINMWDYEMSAEEINRLICGAHGKIVGGTTMQMNGTEAIYSQLLCQDQSVTTTTTTPGMTTTTTPRMTTSTTTTPSMTTTTTTPRMTTTTTTTPRMTTTTTTTTTPSTSTTITTTSTPSMSTTTIVPDTSTLVENTSTATKQRSTTPRFRPRPPSKYKNTPCETSSKFYGICQMNNMECHNGTYTDGLCRRPVNKGQIPSNGGVIYRSCCIEGQATGYEPRGDDF